MSFFPTREERKSSCVALQSLVVCFYRLSSNRCELPCAATICYMMPDCILQGTFGPMATAFNICALVQHWRVSIPPGGTEEHGDAVSDPAWLVA